MSGADLFNHGAAPITWGDGCEGVTRDGGKVEIEIGITGRFIVIVPTRHGVTRRSVKTIEEVRPAAERALAEANA